MVLMIANFKFGLCDHKTHAYIKFIKNNKIIEKHLIFFTNFTL